MKTQNNIFRAEVFQGTLRQNFRCITRKLHAVFSRVEVIHTQKRRFHTKINYSRVAPGTETSSHRRKTSRRPWS